jgi:hypothetical protein
MMYFNCAINVFRNGVGTVIIYWEKSNLPI